MLKLFHVRIEPRLTASALLLASIVVLALSFMPLESTGDISVKPSAMQIVPTVRQGEERVVEFIFRNQTNRTMNFVDVSKSCSCIEVSVDRQSLEPNESAKLEMRFVGGKQPGPLSPRCILSYQSEGSKEIGLKRFGFVTNVELNYICNPGEVSLPNIDGAEASVVILPTNLSEWSIQSAASNRSYVTTTFDQSESGKPKTITVRFDERSYDRDLGDAEIWVTTDSEAIGIIKVPVRISLMQR